MGKDRERNPLPPWETDDDEADRVARAKEAAIQFEAVKSNWRQGKEGIALLLNLSPTDAPTEIALAPIGQRFLCILVPIDQHEEPSKVKPAKTTEQNLVTRAAILCSDNLFQRWLCINGLADEMSEDAAAAAIRDHCHIGSRRELATDPEAARRFRNLYGAYTTGRPM